MSPERPLEGPESASEGRPVLLPVLTDSEAQTLRRALSALIGDLSREIPAPPWRLAGEIEEDLLEAWGLLDRLAGPVPARPSRDT